MITTADNELRKLQVYIDANGPEAAFTREFITRGGTVLRVSEDALVMYQDGSDTLFAFGAFSDMPLLHTASAVMTDREDWFRERLAEGGYAEPLIARNHHLLTDSVPPAPAGGPRIRSALPSDLDFIDMHYSGFSTDREYLRQCIERGMLVAETEGQRAGFIGIHAEGSMGLLYILPEYRHRHCAEALESALIRRLREEDRFVWCQVEDDNTASLRLQKKLGLTPGKQYYWLFRP